MIQICVSMKTDALLPEYLAEPADRAVFGQNPMLAVPRRGVLPPCPMNGRRHLAACDGIWVEARTPALHVMVRLATLPLPYGPVSGFCRLAGGLLPAHLVRELVMASRAADGREIARLAVWRPAQGRYSLLEPGLRSASVAHVTYDAWADRDDAFLAIDIHSHGQGPACFSATDDGSDRMIHEPHLSVVLGRCNGEIETVTRVCIGPHLVTLPTEPFEIPSRSV